jgi:ribosomal protein S27AE
MTNSFTTHQSIEQNIVNQKVALLTKHGKQTLIAPLFLEAFNSTIVHTDTFDTDLLGAFDHSVERTLTPSQAALKKAYLSCEATGCNQGIGSEGSINSIFGVGLVDEEYLAFIDIEKKLEVVARVHLGLALGPIQADTEISLQEQLSKYNNEQAWMLSKNKLDDETQKEQWEKGLTANDLLLRFKDLENIDVYLEPDFRAMHCPDRQTVITKCAEKLIEQLNSFCPECGKVDFDVCHAKVRYLTCELCTLPTNQVQERAKTCSACGFEESIPNVKTVGSAFYCSFCNP